MKERMVDDWWEWLSKQSVGGKSIQTETDSVRWKRKKNNIDSNLPPSVPSHIWLHLFATSL